MNKRHYHLQFCTVCQNRSFDLQRGIVCSLTNEPAAFERTCSSYTEDAQALQGAVKEQKDRSTTANMASHQTRFIHRIIDAVAIAVFYYLIFFRVFFFILTSGFDFILDEVHPLLLSAAFYVFAFFYYLIMEGTTGRTLGKMATGCRVVAADGSKPTWVSLTVRSLVRFVPFEALSFLGTQPTGLHDTLSNTRVIRAVAFNPYSHHTPLSKAVENAQR